MICPSEWLRVRSAYFHFVVLAAVVVFFPGAGNGYELYIGTGEAGGFSYFAGKTICKAISEAEAGIVCQPVVQESQAETLTNLQNGALDLALVDGRSMGKAARGAGLYQYMDIGYETVRLLLPLYREAVVIITGRNTDIASLDDLAGRRLNGGAPSSRESGIFREIMAKKGWDAGSFALYQNLPSKKSQDTIAFKAGTVEAMVYVGIYPDKAKLKEIERMGGRIVPLDGPTVRSLALPENGFGMVGLKAEDLPVLQKDVMTLGVETLLLATIDTDRQTVLSVMRALAGQPERLRRAHPGLLPWKMDRGLLDDRPVAPHPAAITYLTEKEQ